MVTRTEDGTIDAIAGPERLILRTPATLHGEDLKTVGEFTVDAGQSVPFVLSHGQSFASLPAPIDPLKALERTEAFWRQWSDPCPHVGPWTGAVKRSLITLKALTYAPTGGIVAAATTSLPERLGGSRNLHEAVDRIAGQTKVVLHGDFCRIFDLLVATAQGCGKTRGRHSRSNSNLSLAANFRPRN